MTQLYRISLPYATFGVEVRDAVIVDSAPIGRWMRGKALLFVKRWVAGKMGTCELCNQITPVRV